MALPEGAISNAEMQAILALSSDEQAMRAKLLQLTTENRPDGITRVRPFLDRLQDYTRSEVTAEQARSIISALILEGDNLLVPGDEPSSIFNFGTEVSVGRVIYQLLQVLGKEERFETFQSAIERSESLYTVVSEVSVLEGYLGDMPSAEEELVSAPHLQQLRKQALQKIKSAATEGRLMDSLDLLTYLCRWRDWGDIHEARVWVNEQTDSDAGMLKFLSKTKKKITTAGGNEVGSRVHFEVDVGQIEPFVDIQELANRARTILETQGDLSDEHRQTLAELIKRVEKRILTKEYGDSDAL